VTITAESIAFLLLSAITLGGGVGGVVSRNLFHAGLYLMLSLFGVAGLFALLAAPFLAAVQVVIYIGAIAILIILALVFTPDVTRISRGYLREWPAAVAVAALLFVGLVLVLSPLVDELGADRFSAPFTQDNPAPVPGSSLVDLGEQLVDPDAYMLPFELASVLLMGALIGAVLLVRPREEPPDDEPAGDVIEQIASARGDH